MRLDVDYALVETWSRDVENSDVIRYLDKKLAEITADDGPYSTIYLVANTALSIARISAVFFDGYHGNYNDASRMFARLVFDKIPAWDGGNSDFFNEYIKEVADHVKLSTALVERAIEWIWATRRLLAIDNIAREYKKTYKGDPIDVLIWAEGVKEKDSAQRLKQDKREFGKFAPDDE